MVDTYALPDTDERRASRAARAAFWAFMVRWHLENDMVPVAACRACGRNTGNWCDGCEAAGLTFVSYTGQTLLGKPLCNECEGDDVCPICPH